MEEAPPVPGEHQLAIWRKVNWFDLEKMLRPNRLTWLSPICWHREELAHCALLIIDAHYDWYW